MKCYGGVPGGTKHKCLNFSGDPDHHTDCPIGNTAIAANYKGILMKFSG